MAGAAAGVAAVVGVVVFGQAGAAGAAGGGWCSGQRRSARATAQGVQKGEEGHKTRNSAGTAQTDKSVYRHTHTHVTQHKTTNPSTVILAKSV